MNPTTAQSTAAPNDAPSTPTPPAPIALQPGDGEARWFLGGLTTIKSTAEATSSRATVTENLAPQGHGSPLHVHHNEDEWFYVIEGELTFWVGGEVTRAPAGSFLYGPRGVPHTFIVSSPQARFLLVTEPGGFEGFIRALSEAAGEPTLPPASLQPPAPELMMATAAEYGIDIVGPPGIPA
jgi:quercetin dioxygenase-like cupin family protein